MLESLKDIRSMKDIRVEKARLRYEALIAETKMMESFRAVERMFTFFSGLRRVSGGITYAIGVMSKAGGFLSRLFGKPKKEKQNQEDTTACF